MGLLANWINGPQYQGLLAALYGAPGQADVDSQIPGGLRTGGLIGGTPEGQQQAQAFSAAGPQEIDVLRALLAQRVNPMAQAELQGKTLANTGEGLKNEAAGFNLLPYRAFYGDDGMGAAPPGMNAPMNQPTNTPLNAPPVGNMPPPDGNLPPMGGNASSPQNGPSPQNGASPQNSPSPLTMEAPHANLMQSQGAPAGLSPKPGIPIPPGWTPLQAYMAGPAGLNAAYQKFTGPQAVRPGGALPVFDFASGKYNNEYQQPGAPPPGFTFDAKSQSLVPLNNGLQAVAQSAAAAEAGKSGGAYPYQVGLQNNQAANERGNEGFKRGLETATTLTPSYDPATQKTTMITQADALALSRGGTPITAPPPGAPAPAPGGRIGLQSDGSYKTPGGTVIPPAPQAPRPQGGGFQAAPSAADQATQSIYPEIIKGWNDSVQPAAQAEQRFQAMAEALKAVQSGAWTESKAAIGTHLIAAGVDQDTVKSLLNTDPAQVQIILKNNFGASLSQLAASRLGRITQNEIFALQRNLANPSLQPEANLAIVGQGIGIARYQQALANDWNTARQLGYADPLTYQQEWMKANPIQKFVDDATKEVGPLKGMKGAGVPTATGPNGQKLYLRNGQWSPQ